MKQLALLSIFSALFFANASAQSKKNQDQKAIKNMCGCYDVTFNFAETFEYVEDSTYVPSATKHDKGMEWVELIEDNDQKIVLQQVLIVSPPNNQMIVKHWRQDWEFENTKLYEYSHDNKWNFVTLPKDQVKGQWTQRVFQVDDSPRYEGSSSWVHVDGKSYWENTSDAPLPRREETIRSDYNVTGRTNRHEITKIGWIHDQDNTKLLRADGKKDVLIAEEKGHNTYVKVDDSKCKPAQIYWADNHAKWAVVRSKWDQVFARDIDLTLQEKVDNKVLFKYILDDDNYKTSAQIDPIIDAFVK